MRLRLVVLVSLLFVLSVFFSMVSGLLFIPIVPALERLASQATLSDVSVGRIHLTGRSIVFDHVALSSPKGPWVKVLEIRIRPRWTDLLRRKISIARVTLVEPTVTWKGNRISLPPAEPGADGPAVLGFIHQFEIVRGRMVSPFAPEMGPIDLQCTFQKQTVRLDRLVLRVDDSSLHGKGQIGLDSGVFDFNMDLQNVRLDRWMAKKVTLPTDLIMAYSGKARAYGILPAWDLQTEGFLIHGSGEKDGKTQLELKTHFNGPKGEIHGRLAGPLLSGSVEMAVNTERQWVEGQIQWAAPSLTRLAAFWPALSQSGGSISLQGSVKGPWESPDFSAKALGKNLCHGPWTIALFNGEVHRKGANPHPLTLNVFTSSMTWMSDEGKSQGIPSAHLTWVGDMLEGVLGTNVRWPTVALEAHGPAQREGTGFQWQWDSLKALPSQGPEWRAAPGGVLNIQLPKSIEIHDLRIGEEGARLTIHHLAWKNKNLFIDATAVHFPLPFPPSFQGKVNGRFQLKGPLENPVGDFEIFLSSASWNDSPPLDASVIGHVGNAELTFKDVWIGGTDLPTLRGHGFIPWSWILHEDSDQAMDFTIQSGPLDPEIFLKPFPALEVAPGGSIRLDARIQGRRSALKPQGTFLASLPRLKIPAWGMDAQDARVDLKLENDHFFIREATVKLPNGNLRLSGESQWPSLQLELNGTGLAVKMRRQLHFKTDLHLSLGGTWAEPILSGLVSLKEATYERSQKKKGDSDKGPSPSLLSFWDRLQMNVQSEWENKVWYRDVLTKIETQGRLLLSKERGSSALVVSGPLTLLRGSYDAYGRDFILKSGELTFTASEEINPLLNIRAEHKMPQALVELDISGTARNPLLHFRSTPAMSEPDILALLAIGKVSGQSSSSAADPGPTSSAMNLAADVVSDYLTRGVRSSGMNVLDLDVVRVAPAEKGKEWTVGRYWGSKLFLSYSYNPEDAASQVLKAEYTFLPRWTLVGQTGSRSDDYLDLIFRLPIRDRKKTEKKE